LKEGIPETPLELTIALLFYNPGKEGHQRLDKPIFWMVPSHIQRIAGTHLHNLKKVPQEPTLKVSSKNRPKKCGTNANNKH